MKKIDWINVSSPIPIYFACEHIGCKRPGIWRIEKAIKVDEYGFSECNYHYEKRQKKK